MANATAQDELVGVLLSKYPQLALRLAEVAREAYPEYGEARNAERGGRVFVLSPKAAVGDSLPRAEAQAAARLAFPAASYLTGRDLAPLAAEGRPFAERALAAAVTDFSAGLTDQVIPMLLEMQERDRAVADLFFTAVLEECPDEGELGEKLSDLAVQRLQGLPSFQRLAARTTERIRAELEAQANERLARAAAEARAQAARQAAEARVAEVVQALQFYFAARDDVPSPTALATMNACTDLTTARCWLKRAYAGDTSAVIFPDANDTN
jgi:hypothetical protein